MQNNFEMSEDASRILEEVETNRPVETTDKSTSTTVDANDEKSADNTKPDAENASKRNNSTSRKCRKRKRYNHFHNKNKKWGKQFKRQLGQNNNNKSDIDVIQNSKNTNSRKYAYGQKSLRSIFKHVSRRNPSLSKFFLPDKRPRKELIIPPTKFLLGGNISDPLNLNSLQDEALNASMNAATPKSSPLTTPPKIEVIIPPNIYDPLHLMDPVDSIEYEKLLISPLKRRIKHRNRKKKLRKRQESIVDVLGGNDDCAITKIDKEDKMPVTDNSGDTIQNREISTDVQIEKDDLLTEREKCIKDLRLELNIDGTGTGGSGRKRKISESQCSGKNKLRRMDSMDKIVSPVIPQPGAWKRPPQVLPMGAPRNRHRVSSTSISDEFANVIDSEKTETIDHLQPCEQSVSEMVTPAEETKLEEEGPIMPAFKKENAKYQYGNHCRYFGFHNLDEYMDVRLLIFKRNAFLFKDKDILDIGCNTGHMTIAIAKKLHPKSIMGIDIDKDLVSKARKKLSLYVKIPQLDNGNGKVDNENKDDSKSQIEIDSVQEKKRVSKLHKREKLKDGYFPMSFPLCYGGIPNLSTDKTVDLSCHDERQKFADDKEQQHNFPNNIFFRTINYVLSDESQLNADTQQYDLILCLSTTKWIHLNFGDAGLKIAFKRMFNQLRPGGKLILEAQNWASYKKKKKLTETIFNNYKNIEFFPNKFHEYLLGPEVGFSHSYPLGIPRHLSKGFRRPIQLYVKGDYTPSQIRWSDSYHPQTPYEPYRGYYASTLKRSRHPRSSAWTGPDMTPQAASVSYAAMFTPSQGLSSTSQYYNPLETDSYLPSYDTEIQNRHYCFASPLYSTVWSPPTSGRRSASQTPLFGSIRRVNDAEELATKRHVYWPSSIGCSDVAGGRESSRSLDESSRSPQTRHVYATVSCNNSVREPEVESNSPKNHVYATACDASSSSPVQQYSGESSRSVEIDQDEITEDSFIDTTTNKKELD